MLHRVLLILGYKELGDGNFMDYFLPLVVIDKVHQCSGKAADLISVMC